MSDDIRSAPFIDPSAAQHVFDEFKAETERRRTMFEAILTDRDGDGQAGITPSHKPRV